MLRIHFTPDDLTRIRLVSGPDPLWEILLGLHLLGKSDGDLVFGEWKRQARATLRGRLPMLSQLAPPYGYSADFLTPYADIPSLEAGIDAVLSTPRTRLRNDVRLLDRQKQLPSWANQLADGEVEILERLGDELRDYHRAAIVPCHDSVADHVAADRVHRLRTLADHGVERLLSTLHPTIRWDAPVLRIEYPKDRCIRLDGRGLVLVPAFFCWLNPITVRDPQLAPVLVYPIEHDPGSLRPRPHRPRALAALLGDRRAAILEIFLDRNERTVGEIACSVGVSLSTASQHATILRTAGLLTSRRYGKYVVYSITTLGRKLMEDGLASHSGGSITPSPHRKLAARP